MQSKKLSNKTRSRKRRRSRGWRAC